MQQRLFPRPWRFGPVPGGYRVIIANDLVLAHVYGEPPNAVATSPNRLTDDEARRISMLITRWSGSSVIETGRAAVASPSRSGSSR
jgi:hypothetical protein